MILTDSDGLLDNPAAYYASQSTPTPDQTEIEEILDDFLEACTDEDYSAQQALEAKKTAFNEALAAISKLNEGARLAGENYGRSDELVRLSEWGKTIDDQWNAHFKERLKSLKKGI